MKDLINTDKSSLKNRIDNILEEYYINSNELKELTLDLIKTVKLKSLKNVIDKICMNLSQVGEPIWYADAKDIAWDNQKRLTTIYMLLDTYKKIEVDVKNIKKNKNTCIENDDYLYSFISRIKDLFELENKFKEIKKKEITDTIEFYKFLDELHNANKNDLLND